MNIIGNTIMDLLGSSFSSPQNVIASQVKDFKARGDSIAAAGERVVEINGGFTTELLAQIENQNFSFPLTLVGLQIQSKCLPEVCALAYVAASRQFVDNVTPELAREYITEVEDIIRGLAHFSCLTRIPKAVAGLIQRAIDKAVVNRSEFTTLYTDYLQVCIKGQLYGNALKLLEEYEVLSVAPRCEKQTEELLKYFYYSGICYISNKDYVKALESFISCITIPANVLSQVVINAVKKAKLVALLATGERLELPRYTSNIVNRFVAEELPVYDDLVRKYFSQNVHDLSESIISHSEALNGDNNLGLAKQLVRAWKNKQILKLSKSYLALRLDHLAEKCKFDDLAEAESALLEMIAAGSVTAHINSSSGEVQFEEQEDRARNMRINRTRLTATIEESMHQIVNLSEKLREDQKEILNSTEYVLKATNSSRGGSLGLAPGYWTGSGTMEFS